MDKQMVERLKGELDQVRHLLDVADDGDSDKTLVVAVVKLANIVETMVKAEETRQAQAQEAEDFQAEHGWHLGRQ